MVKEVAGGVTTAFGIFILPVFLITCGESDSFVNNKWLITVQTNILKTIKSA